MIAYNIMIYYIMIVCYIILYHIILCYIVLCVSYARPGAGAPRQPEARRLRHGHRGLPYDIMCVCIYIYIGICYDNNTNSDNIIFIIISFTILYDTIIQYVTNIYIV